MILSVPLFSVAERWARVPTHTRVLLALFLTVLAVDLLFRWLAPRSRAYAGWKAFFERVGHVWTVAILSIVYVVAVGPMRAAMALAGKDLLDRATRGETSAWRPHVPNPLGPEAAARHQF